MKKLIFILIIQVCLMPALLYAQPKWAGKAAKSVFTLKTFKQDGSLLASGNGFFIGNEGEAVSNFSPFVGASRAVIIDASGKEMKVECITGANDLYDVARFRVSGKVSGLPVAMTTTTGSTAWVLPYSANKSARSQQGTIEKIDKAGDYDYYTLVMQMPENTVGCPLLNENGEAIGIMQLSVGDSNKSYAIAVQFALGLKITGLSFNEQVYKSTSVKKDLPNELEQAIVALYVSGPQMAKESYREMIDDFIRKFPTAADGYTYRAQEEVNDNLFDDADRDMQQAVKMASKKDEAHFSFAKLIFQKEIFKNDRTYSGWTLDKAIAEAEAYDGPSLIIAYAPCINHGIKVGMNRSQEEAKKATASGYWNMLRFNPALAEKGENPLTIDSKEATESYRDFLMGEVRYNSLAARFPEKAEALFEEAEKQSKERFEHLQALKDSYDKA